MQEKALVFKALGDETRLQIIAMLSRENLCACQLQDSFSITAATLSYHLKILQEAGLIQGQKEGYWTRYSLDKPKIETVMQSLGQWVDRKASNPAIRCQTR